MSLEHVTKNQAISPRHKRLRKRLMQLRQSSIATAQTPEAMPPRQSPFKTQRPQPGKMRLQVVVSVTLHREDIAQECSVLKKSAGACSVPFMCLAKTIKMLRE